MQKKENVSMSVIRRLPRYYRFLSEISRNGETRISSKELSEKMGFTASQIRQDFNCFGGFGQQGYGYNVKQLCSEIEQILGLPNQHTCILVGAGNLGRAIAGHMQFSQLGFKLVGVFDNSPKVIGEKVGNLAVRPYREVAGFFQSARPAMAILCVPKEAVEKVADELYDMGFRSFWNFSHFDIGLKHTDCIVENVHMNDSLMTLCYKLSQLPESQ